MITTQGIAGQMEGKPTYKKTSASLQAALDEVARMEGVAELDTYYFITPKGFFKMDLGQCYIRTHIEPDKYEPCNFPLKLIR